MPENAIDFKDVVRLAAYTGRLRALRDCGDDDAIDRAFNAVCREIWGYTLEDFGDDSLSEKDHALLDRMTSKRALKFAAENGYDLTDTSTGQVVTDWWGFTWMILAEKRGLLTPEGRAATWRRNDVRCTVVKFRAAR